MMFGAMAIGIAALMAAPQVAHSANAGVVTGAAALNLRSCAGVTCPRIATMPNGASVLIDGATGGWYHLSYGGLVGYASARYISTGGAAAAVPTAAKMFKKPQTMPSHESSDDSGSSGGSYGGY